MYTILDGEKRLQGISSSPLGENSIELEVNSDHEVMHNPYIYRYIDGKLVRDNEQHLQEVKKEKIEEMKIVCEEKIKQGFLSSNGNYYRSEEHTSELQSRFDLVCRLLLEKKNTTRP